MSTVTLIVPEICITLAPESVIISNNSNNNSQTVQNASPVVANSARLVVPPPTVDGPSRRTLVQRGLRLGSYRLNCAESLQSSRGFADAASMRRTFNWSRSPLSSVPMSGRSQRGHGHARARSLASITDLNDCLKVSGVNNNNSGHPIINTTGHNYHHHHRTHQTNYSEPTRTSIDLSVLSSKAFASPTEFTFVL